MYQMSTNKSIKCTKIDSVIKAKDQNKGLIAKPDKYISVCLNCTRTRCVTGECKVVGGRYDVK